MGLVDEIGLAARTEKIAATPLADNLLAMGTAVLHAQGRALVTERQTSLRVLRDPTGAGAAAATAQATLRDAASHYLDVVQPRALALFAQTDGVTNLMNALTGLDGPSTPGGELSRMLNAVADSFDKLTGTARDLEKVSGASAEVTAGAARTLSKALTAAIKQLEGENGEIAKTRAQIDETEKAIYDAIDDIVRNSNVVRGGVKGLVTYVMGLFGGGDEATQKPKAPEKAPEKTAETKPAEPPAKDSGEIEPFPAESIDTISTGIEGVAAAEARIKAKNTILAQQYQDLAALGALLAAVQAISNQTGAMADTAQKLHDAAAATPKITTAIADGLRDLAAQAIRPTNRKDVMATITATADSWTLLCTQLRQSAATFAGIGKLFPPLVLVKR
jgi:hypothetical protein